MLYCLILPVFLFFSISFDSNAARYAENSALASGKWKKVKVEKTGMQFISNTALKNMGFSNPAKVNVFGFGGRLIPEALSSNDPDDLPILPIVRTSKGICFFGFNHIRWDRSRESGSLTYKHSMQPYAEESYYFISDIDTEEYTLPEADASNTTGLPRLESFTQMLLHEQELFYPSTSGRVCLGEDFRSPTHRSFNFSLTDLASGSARARVSFATKTSGPASIAISANGMQLNSSSADNFSAVTSSDQFMNLRTTVKTIEHPSQSLDLAISFTNSGTITLARLDFIEVEYPRLFKMNGGELLFNTNADRRSSVTLSGCEQSTEIWDITDPVKPTRLSYTLSGSNANFAVNAGAHEFIAFTPDKCGSPITAGLDVANQNLHALEIPDMLIITPMEYSAAAETLAEHHRSHDGLKVHVLTPEPIYNEFSSGTVDVSAFRKLLKMWYDRGLEVSSTDLDSESSQIKYCLILSRPTYDHKLLMTATQNAGYPRIPIWQSLTGNSKNTSYSTDDFIGMLDDCPAGLDIGSAKIRVAVGRMPFTSSSEASILVKKYIDYVLNPNLGAWRNNIMIIADDQDGGVHFDQAQDVYNRYSNSERGSQYLYERLYLDIYKMEADALGNTYPEAKERMLRLWNDGVAMIDYIGHASTVGWGHENLLTWNDINSFSNKNLPFLYAATCEFARLDDDTRCGAEILWAYPEAGIIATICPSRTVFISPNGVLSNKVADAFFKIDDSGLGRRIGDIMIEAKNSYSGTDDNKLRYTLIGNPAMRFPLPKYQVEAQTINDVDVSNVNADSDYPELPARGKAIVAGVIRDNQGNIADNFNGNIELILYDAEKVVETNGNGYDGVVKYYNDRKTLLHKGMARVVNGRWTSTVFIPSEIENNRTQARFTFYAYSDAGIDAHGENHNFYVYGYDKNAQEDTDGPDINLFALNRESFQNGDVVHSSPVVLAKVSDPSGINLSDAGIGHKITLILDGNTCFEDVNSYYSPDPDDPQSGSLMYPLPTLDAGKHNLKLMLWDTANNSSSAELEFEVAVAKAPEIYDLTTDANPAHDIVNFTLSTDRPMAAVNCLIEVFDLNGRRMWSSDSNVATDILASINVAWDLKDTSGVRVPRGIYLYRATITSENGTSVTRTKKLAVAAQ